MGVFKVSTAAKNIDQKLKTLIQEQVSSERLFIYKSLSLLAGEHGYRYLIAFFCHLQPYISLITINRTIGRIQTLQNTIVPYI